MLEEKKKSKGFLSGISERSLDLESDAAEGWVGEPAGVEGDEGKVHCDLLAKVLSHLHRGTCALRTRAQNPRSDPTS
eukprot:2887831-Rhodomonas_salina.1